MTFKEEVLSLLGYSVIDEGFLYNIKLKKLMKKAQDLTKQRETEQDMSKKLELAKQINDITKQINDLRNQNSNY